MAEIVKAVVKNHIDTAANLTSDNITPLSGEITIDSTTNRFKFGDGSASWLNLPYVNQGLPLSFDISSSNTVIALPTITGKIQRQRYYWASGNGSNTFSFTVPDAATIGGLTATTWIGRMKGYIDLESDGVSDWKVVEFVDTPDDDNTQQDQMNKCKAWVNFNGTGTVAIRDSYNVSSITDNAPGLYTINFTNNMSNANYSMSGSAGGSNDSYVVTCDDSVTPRTVSAIVINSILSNVTNVDDAVISVQIFGS